VLILPGLLLAAIQVLILSDPYSKVKNRWGKKKGYGKINLHSVQLQSILYFHHEAGNLIKFGKLA